MPSGARQFVQAAQQGRRASERQQLLGMVAGEPLDHLGSVDLIRPAAGTMGSAHLAPPEAGRWTC